MLSKSELIQLASENGYDVIFKDKTSSIDMGGGDKEVTIGLISGETWTEIITNSNLNGKIDKQKIWNAFNYTTRESDGWLSTYTDPTFKWIVIASRSRYIYTFSIENIQNNDGSNCYTKLSANNPKIYLNTDNTMYHLYADYAQQGLYYGYTSHSTSINVIYSKSFIYNTNTRIYHRGFGTYIEYKDINTVAGNELFPWFQNFPSFRPQFIFKESS